MEISVLVVDDSAVTRRLVATVLATDGGVRVVGDAADGRQALDMVDRLRPDLVVLDVEMPVLDGVGTVAQLRRRHPRLPVIMFSALTTAGAEATLAALAAGATDYVTKPTGRTRLSDSVASVRAQLLPRIHALCARPGPQRRPEPDRPEPDHPEAASRPGQPVRAVLLGASTGGPEALRQVIGELPAALPVPVLVVQHMPPLFTAHLARRLDLAGGPHVVEAASGVVPRPGTVYLAPGDRHLEVTRTGAEVRTRLHGGPKENHCRPAVDVLFRSAAAVYGAGVLAVVLTGMGCDGRRGAAALRAGGAHIVAQDEATSVVWGMPGAVAGARLADAVVPLPAVARHILARLAPWHSTPAVAGAR